METHEPQNIFKEIEDKLYTITSFIEVVAHSCENEEYYSEFEVLEYVLKLQRELFNKICSYEQ